MPPSWTKATHQVFVRMLGSAVAPAANASSFSSAAAKHTQGPDLQAAGPSGFQAFKRTSQNRKPSEVVQTDCNDQQQREHIQAIDGGAVHPLRQLASHHGAHDGHKAHTDKHDKGKIGHAAADEGIDKARRLRKRDDEQGGLSRRLAFHGEEEHQDGQVERSAADTEERPAGTGQKTGKGLRSGTTKLNAGDTVFVEGVYENKHGEDDEHRRLCRTHKIGVGKSGNHLVEGDLARHTAHRGADSDGHQGPRVD